MNSKYEIAHILIPAVIATAVISGISVASVVTAKKPEPVVVTKSKIESIQEILAEEPAKIVVKKTSAQCSGFKINPHVTTGDKDYQDKLYTHKGDRVLITPKNINEKQAELLAYAYQVAKDDGHKDPTVLQGLIWQESHAGGYPGYEVAGDEAGLRVGKRYYGVGQIKVAAAKDVFRHFKEDFPEMQKVKDEYIIAKLIMDDKFNIRVASKYLWMMKHNIKTSYVRPTNYAITAYNRGLGNTYGTDYNNWHYTVSVNEHRETVIKEFNTANKLAK